MQFTLAFFILQPLHNSQLFWGDSPYIDFCLNRIYIVIIQG